MQNTPRREPEAPALLERAYGFLQQHAMLRLS
jgi:hypothetical protein